MRNGNVVRFFFGAHAGAEDVAATREHFDWCTVYVPELLGWTFASHVQYRAIAIGGVPAYLAAQLLSFQFRIFRTAEMEMIEGSGKRIEFVDVPGGHALLLVTKAVHRAFDRLVYADCDWPSLMQSAGDMADAVNIVNRHRMRHILASLCSLNELLTDQRILVRLGAGHASLAALAVRRGLDVQQVFQRIGPYAPEGLIVHYGQLDRPIPSALLAQHIMACMIDRFCSAIVPPGNIVQMVAWITRMVSRFSESEIAELWQRFRDDEAEATQALGLLIRARER